MIYLSDCFHSVKIFYSTLGVISSLSLLIYSFVNNDNLASNLLYRISGCTLLIVSGFTCFDSSKATNEIKKQVRRLHAEVILFQRENQELEKIRNNFNTDLAKILEEHNTQLIEFKKTNIKLLNETTDLTSIKEELSLQVEKYKNLLDQSDKELLKVDTILKTFKEENEKLIDQNKTLNVSLDRLVKIYNDTKQLLVNLALVGDEYNQFANNIDTSIINLDMKISSIDAVSVQLNNLLSILKKNTFNDLDANNDGNINIMEFEAGLHKGALPL